MLRKTTFGIVLALLFTILSSALFTQTIVASSGITFSDNFSSDSGMWEYIGSAYRDPTNQYLVLTEPIGNQGGVAFFRTPFKTTFTANFSYRAGGGSGADGLAMFFYKQKYSFFDTGGGLGFSGRYPNRDIPGYGIEFDNWQNIGASIDEPIDPSANHIALIKDFVGNHLIYVDDLRTEDNNWHNVSVVVEDSSIKVIVDQGIVFTWSGTIDRTFDYFGFCAGTGAATNWHIIDNFSIDIHEPITASIDIKPDALCLKSRGKWVTSFNELPEGYDASEIDVSTIRMNSSIPVDSKAPVQIGDYDLDGIQEPMVKFDRQAVLDLVLSNCQLAGPFGTATLTITGELNDQTQFRGSDIIQTSI